jgi:hypothetical protein
MRRWPPNHRVAPVLVVGAMLAFQSMLALAQTVQVHGENSSFAGHGVAMVWGVLRGTSEADAQVILRIALAGGAFAAVSLEGVDPFTQRRHEFAGIRTLGIGLDLRTARASFADFPRREIHFYTAEDQQANRPSLTVYFMGLPDTTPEFATEVAVGDYLIETMTKLTGPKGRTP